MTSSGVQIFCTILFFEFELYVKVITSQKSLVMSFKLNMGQKKTKFGEAAEVIKPQS